MLNKKSRFLILSDDGSDAVSAAVFAPKPTLRQAPSAKPMAKIKRQSPVLKVAIMR